jgi:hypothetical protein
LPPGGDKRRIVTATRRLRGRRPKAAVLLATHVINEKAPSYRRRHFHTDYDAFWVERRGAPEPDFGFRLPLLPPRGKTDAAILIDDLVGACLEPRRRTSLKVGLAGDCLRAIRRLPPFHEASAANSNCRSDGGGDIPAEVLPWRAGVRSRPDFATPSLLPTPSGLIRTDGAV